VKLLLGDEIVPRWHGGLNLFFEQQVGDAREWEVAASGAVSYAIIDERLSFGVEAEFNAERENAEGDALGDGDGGYTYKFRIGPSLQWRPSERIHVDVVPLFGAIDRSPVVESFVFVGFDLGPGSEREHPEVEVPASMRTR
jgi:hypothetical protein